MTMRNWMIVTLSAWVAVLTLWTYHLHARLAENEVDDLRVVQTCCTPTDD